MSLELVIVLLPAALLAIALLFGRYPGENIIERARAARHAGAARRRRDPVVRRPASPLLLARGGRLVAAAIAARPPPAVWMDTH